MNEILTDYLNGLLIITVPLSLFAIIPLLLGLSQIITNKRLKPVTDKLSRFGNFILLIALILVAASQLHIVFR